MTLNSAESVRTTADIVSAMAAFRNGRRIAGWASANMSQMLSVDVGRRTIDEMAVGREREREAERERAGVKQSQGESFRSKAKSNPPVSVDVQRESPTAGQPAPASFPRVPSGDSQRDAAQVINNNRRSLVSGVSAGAASTMNLMAQVAPYAMRRRKGEVTWKKKIFGIGGWSGRSLRGSQSVQIGSLVLQGVRGYDESSQVAAKERQAHTPDLKTLL